MLAYFEPAALCAYQPDLIMAPLPSNKRLWEAGDEFAWRTEKSQRVPQPSQTVFALAATGDLVLVEEDQIQCSDAVLLRESCSDTPRRTRTPANWEEWCSGMDALGGLVMLAASLIV
jgi:hypothetical protein